MSAARAPRPSQSLTIVIPALNEEDAIAGTISRCLDAVEHICTVSNLESVEIIVVSDGSTDRTAEIANEFEDVTTIVFEKNRGYGAAIKEGWRQGSGSLVGFLDADGTCDPTYFAEMCRVAIEHPADVVLGSRLGPDSKMPTIRRVGNRIYAFLLGLLCGKYVVDTASGMRVVRRESLRFLYPLPDGLHFTPSMSARALMNNLRVVEVPMKYEERIGESKLNVLRDGVQFFRSIFDSVLCYRPEKILTTLFLICCVMIAFVSAFPVEYYFKNSRLEDWMIYRFVLSFLLGTFATTFLLASALISRVAGFGPRLSNDSPFWPTLVANILQDRRALIGLLVGLLLATLIALWPGVTQYVTTGSVTMHWSRLLAGTFTLNMAAQIGIFSLLLRIVDIWIFQMNRVEPHTEPEARGPELMSA